MLTHDSRPSALSPTRIAALHNFQREISFCQKVSAQQENFRPGIAGEKESRLDEVKQARL